MLHGVFRGEGVVRLIAGDGLMLRPVVHENPLYILHACAEEYVAYKYAKAHKSLDKALCGGGGGAAPEYKAAYKLGQQKEKAYGQRHGQYHRKAHHNLFHRLAQLFRQPLLEFCGLLVYGVAYKLRGSGEGIHAYGKALHEGHHAPHYGEAVEGTLLSLCLIFFIIQYYAALCVPDRHGDAAGGLHHDALHNGLTADRTFLH